MHDAQEDDVEGHEGDELLCHRRHARDEPAPRVELHLSTASMAAVSRAIVSGATVSMAAVSSTTVSAELHRADALPLVSQPRRLVQRLTEDVALHRREPRVAELRDG